MTAFRVSRTTVRQALIAFSLTIPLCQPLAAQDDKKEDDPNSSKPTESISLNVDEIAPSKLTRAIDRGMKPGGNLADEIDKLEDFSIETRDDARALCEVLKVFPLPNDSSNGIHTSLGAVVELFEEVDSENGSLNRVLREQGLPQLIRIYDLKAKEELTDDNVDDLLSILRIFVLYSSKDGIDRLVQAAQKPIGVDDYTWIGLLGMFSRKHPQASSVYRRLSDPIPPGFIGIALLDSANDACLNGNLKQHPFNSEAGAARLKAWLSDPNEISYAHSAAFGTAWIDEKYRAPLLELALAYPDYEVQLEAAWASAKSGEERGFEKLVEACKNVHTAKRGHGYLEELEQADRIPAETQEPKFLAMAEFSSWLQHPNELGVPPDELEVVDQRDLKWPFQDEATPFYVIRYLHRDKDGIEDDEIDCGLVGSMTWCFFYKNMHRRPPEDVYAIHCYFEMLQNELIIEDDEINPIRYAAKVGKWDQEKLSESKIVCAARVSKKFGIPNRTVVVIRAKKSGEEGWAVVDDAGNAWYPKSDQPDDSTEKLILMLHIGRTFLNFDEQPDRKKYLEVVTPKRPAAEVVANFEKQLEAITQLAPEKRMDKWSASEHLERYVKLKSDLTKTPESEILITTYEKFLELGLSLPKKDQELAFSSYGAMSDHFEKYADAKIQAGGQEQVKETLGKLAPIWNDFFGNELVGSVALKLGDNSLAEERLALYANELPFQPKVDSLVRLCEIWLAKGDSEKAKELLVKLLQRIQTSYSDTLNEEVKGDLALDYQKVRAAYLKMFSGTETELKELGFPERVDE